MKCPSCGSESFSKPYKDIFPVNGTDDPMDCGGYEEVALVNCLECGDAYILDELNNHNPVIDKTA